MAVEIKELVIRAVMREAGEEAPREECVALTVTDREALVDLCVKEVLRVIKATKER